MLLEALRHWSWSWWRHHWPFVCVCVGGGGGGFTGHRWIPRTTTSDAELWWFLWCAPETNNHEAGDLKRHRGHYDVIVMEICFRHTSLNFTFTKASDAAFWCFFLSASEQTVELSKQSGRRWFETPSRSLLWRHCNISERSRAILLDAEDPYRRNVVKNN